MSPRVSFFLTLGLSLATILGAVWWTLGFTSASAQRAETERHARALSAQLALDGRLHDTQWALDRLALFVAADRRVGVALSTPVLDTATLEDALGEVQETVDAELLVLFSLKGTALAVKGKAHSALRGMTLLTAADLELLRQDQRVAHLWFKDQSATLVALRPVKARDELIGFALVGRQVDNAALLSVATVLGGTVGFRGTHGEWLGSGPLRADQPVEESPSETLPEVSIAAQLTVAPEVSQVWLPMVLVAVMAVWSVLTTFLRASRV